MIRREGKVTGETDRDCATGKAAASAFVSYFPVLLPGFEKQSALREVRGQQFVSPLSACQLRAIFELAPHRRCGRTRVRLLTRPPSGVLEMADGGAPVGQTWGNINLVGRVTAAVRIAPRGLPIVMSLARWREVVGVIWVRFSVVPLALVSLPRPPCRTRASSGCTPTDSRGESREAGATLTFRRGVSSAQSRWSDEGGQSKQVCILCCLPAGAAFLRETAALLFPPMLTDAPRSRYQISNSFYGCASREAISLPLSKRRALP